MSWGLPRVMTAPYLQKILAQFTAPVTKIPMPNRLGKRAALIPTKVTHAGTT